MWGCFLMSGVKILHFLKDWWKSIPIHQNYAMALMLFSYFTYCAFQTSQSLCLKTPILLWSHRRMGVLGMLGKTSWYSIDVSGNDRHNSLSSPTFFTCFLLPKYGSTNDYNDSLYLPLLTLWISGLGINFSFQLSYNSNLLNVWGAAPSMLKGSWAPPGDTQNPENPSSRHSSGILYAIRATVLQNFDICMLFAIP